MNNMVKWIAALLLPVATVNAQPADTTDTLVLSPFVAEYAVYKWGGQIGTATMTLSQLDDEHYHFEHASHVSKFFLTDRRHEESHFRVVEQQLLPISYDYKRTGTGPNKSLNVRFDSTPEGQSVSINGEKQPWQGELDNQLYRLLIRQWLREGKTSFSVDFINYRGDLHAYEMKVIDNESLALPMGTFDTIKVIINRASSRRQTLMWFAPTLDYQLVRLQQFTDGDELGDLRLVKYQSP